MPTRTEGEKAEMLRLREEENLSNAEIGRRYGISGDAVYKVLLRFTAGRRGSGEVMPDTLAEAEAAPADGLRRLHDEFDAKVPERTASRPKWAGRPPLRIMPKDFQK